MEIHLSTDESIRLTDSGPGLAFEPGEAESLSPFHLLAASLATCTYSVLQSYGQHARLPLDSLAIDVAWTLGGDPFRVIDMEMVLHWPGLPPARREAARRAAAHCTIHQTLGHDLEVRTLVDEPDASP